MLICARYTAACLAYPHLTNFSSSIFLRTIITHSQRRTITSHPHQQQHQHSSTPASHRPTTMTKGPPPPAILQPQTSSSQARPAMHILISGAGIAGPALAHWLHHGLQPTHTPHITIVERAPAPRPGGQAVDIRGPAVPIIERMGLEPGVRARNTTEIGMQFVNDQGRPRARFGASGDKNNQSFTSEYEILRGDFAELLADATKDFTTFVYGESVARLEQDSQTKKVRVEFENGKVPAGEYDVVVAADGLGSKTRGMAFGEEVSRRSIRSLDRWLVLYTIPREEGDSNWAKWWNGAGGRCILLRPDRFGTMRTCLSLPMDEASGRDALFKGDVASQKQALREAFRGVGWQSERMLRELEHAEGFYCQHVAQVKMDEVVKGSVALLGDAGYCPSPYSGHGTTLALIGAYVLAGEICSSPFDIPAALKRYDTKMQPYIQEMQGLLPGGVSAWNPASKTGIAILRTVLGAASKVPFDKVEKIASFFGNDKAKKESEQPPHYPALPI